MKEQRPFTAASNKFAYAQAFAGPAARRQTEHVRGHLHISQKLRSTLQRGRHTKPTSAAA